MYSSDGFPLPERGRWDTRPWNPTPRDRAGSDNHAVRPLPPGQCGTRPHGTPLSRRLRQHDAGLHKASRCGVVLLAPPHRRRPASSPPGFNAVAHRTQVFDNAGAKGGEFLLQGKGGCQAQTTVVPLGPRARFGQARNFVRWDQVHCREGPEKELGRVCWPTCLGDWGFARRTSDIHRDISGSFHPGGRRKRVPCSFSGLPEALTGGTDLEDTREQATDCLAEALAGRIKRGDEIPRPRKPKRGQHSISVPLSLAPKLALYLAMRDSGMRNTGLTKRLGVSETVVRRMLDPRPTTRPERIQAALTELGKRIVITFEDAA